MQNQGLPQIWDSPVIIGAKSDLHGHIIDRVGFALQGSLIHMALAYGDASGGRTVTNESDVVMTVIITL